MSLVCFYLQLYILLLFFFFGFVLYLFSNFITVLGLVKSVAESSLCINDCATCPSQFSDPAKVYDLVSPSQYLTLYSVNMTYNLKKSIIQWESVCI